MKQPVRPGNLVDSRDGTIVHSQPDGVRIPNRNCTGQASSDRLLENPFSSRMPQ
jgi:hypothetical protein